MISQPAEARGRSLTRRYRQLHGLEQAFYSYGFNLCRVEQRIEVGVTSEFQFRPKLHHPRSTDGARDPAKVGTAQLIIRRSEVGSVENIEDVPAKLHSNVFRELRALHNT